MTPDRTGWGHTVTITRAGARRLHPGEQQAAAPGSRDRGDPGVEQDPRDPEHLAGRHLHHAIQVRGGYQGVARFWLQVSSLPEADFPLAPPAPRVDRDRRCPHPEEEDSPCRGSLAKRTTSRGSRAASPRSRTPPPAAAMIARHRGEHDIRHPWTPLRSRHAVPSTGDPASTANPGDDAVITTADRQ